ncbi:MAG: hypothetical protein U5K33_06390 [Halofilum sp. (in: g-proteobacteria)]|nr:hypothetical protein [Halofilum sp. (in: g-proteobacteria)]
MPASAIKRWSALPAATVLGLGLASPASAALIDINISTVASVGDAQAALDNFRAGKRHSLTEDFEGFSAWDGTAGSATSDPLNSVVGTFSSIGANGTGTACVDGCDHLQVADSDSPGLGGSGRMNLTDGGSNWLDSNDIEGIEWLVDAAGIGGSFTDLAFFMTDVADVGATLDLVFDNGDTGSAEITPTQGNGTINFVTASFSDMAIGATVTMRNTSGQTTNDGFGIDGATVAVPVPGTLLLLGTGLLAIGAAARRGGSADKA